MMRFRSFSSAWLRLVASAILLVSISGCTRRNPEPCKDEGLKICAEDAGGFLCQMIRSGHEDQTDESLSTFFRNLVGVEPSMRRSLVCARLSGQRQFSVVFSYPAQKIPAEIFSTEPYSPRMRVQNDNEFSGDAYPGATFNGGTGVYNCNCRWNSQLFWRLNFDSSDGSASGIVFRKIVQLNQFLEDLHRLKDVNTTARIEVTFSGFVDEVDYQIVECDGKNCPQNPTEIGIGQILFEIHEVEFRGANVTLGIPGNAEMNEKRVPIDRALALYRKRLNDSYSTYMK